MPHAAFTMHRAELVARKVSWKPQSTQCLGLFCLLPAISFQQTQAFLAVLRAVRPLAADVAATRQHPSLCWEQPQHLITLTLLMCFSQGVSSCKHTLDTAPKQALSSKYSHMCACCQPSTAPYIFQRGSSLTMADTAHVSVSHSKDFKLWTSPEIVSSQYGGILLLSLLLLLKIHFYFWVLVGILEINLLISNFKSTLQ